MNIWDTLKSRVHQTTGDVRPGWLFKNNYEILRNSSLYPLSRATHRNPAYDVPRFFLLRAVACRKDATASLDE